tara:strand:- start:695 stop:1159 length:465 start_codon:yes stop_codon:yes gene_type:complete
MDTHIYLLHAFGIEATPEDVETILDLSNIEDGAIPALEAEAADLRSRLAEVEEQLDGWKDHVAKAKAKIGELKSNVSRSSGLPIESNEHRSRAGAALYYLRQRATVEPVHRGEVAQYVYGERNDLNMSRLALVLNVLKRKGLVRNGPRGYWFPL